MLLLRKPLGQQITFNYRALISYLQLQSLELQGLLIFLQGYFSDIRNRLFQIEITEKWEILKKWGESGISKSESD